MEAHSSASLFARARQHARALGLEEPSAIAVGGASDGNFTAGMGVPTLDGLGAVGGGAHADDEHVLVDELANRTAVLASLIADLTGSQLDLGRHR
jgi:glutamate carboxypeptidase